jgi:hypothetical protein
VKLPLVLIISIVAIGLLILFIRHRRAIAYRVVSGEIPEVLAQLQASGMEGNRSVLWISPRDASVGDGINLQYSIDQGVVGLDWVLVGSRNVADKSKIAEMAAALGYQVEERERNHLLHLRVTGQGISELGMAIIRDFYNVSPATEIRMITEGFKWNPHAHWK